MLQILRHVENDSSGQYLIALLYQWNMKISVRVRRVNFGRL